MLTSKFNDIPHQVIPTAEENEILYRLDDAYRQKSEMTIKECEFLNALILRNKPRKLVEIGVSAGSSSVVMINAIKEFPGAVLHSINYAENWYRSPDIKSGWIMDKYPELKKNWTLYAGGLSLRFAEKIVL